MILNAQSFKESVHTMQQTRFASVKKITKDQFVQVLKFFFILFLKIATSKWLYCLTLKPKERGSTKLEWDSDTQLIYMQIKKVMGWGELVSCNPPKEAISAKFKRKHYLGFLKRDDV